MFWSKFDEFQDQTKYSPTQMRLFFIRVVKTVTLLHFFASNVSRNGGGIPGGNRGDGGDRDGGN